LFCLSWLRLGGFRFRQPDALSVGRAKYRFRCESCAGRKAHSDRAQKEVNMFVHGYGG
jgi:hypothetical protein